MIYEIFFVNNKKFLNIQHNLDFAIALFNYIFLISGKYELTNQQGLNSSQFFKKSIFTNQTNNLSYQTITQKSITQLPSQDQAQVQESIENKRIWNQYKLDLSFKKYKIQKMELQRPLKFEGQYFGIQTDSDIHECFQESFLNEPLQSSHYFSEQNTGCESSIQIIDRIRYSADIALTPMTELIALAKQDLDWSSNCQEELKRNLKKTKLIEKRERAKNRKHENRTFQIISHKFFQTNLKNRDEDIKKQKNRLSAQISRDRKKQHYMKLEAQNAELRRILDQVNKNNIQFQIKINKENQQCKKPKQSSFKMLLIFLGLIFFLNLIKNVVGSNGRKTDQTCPLSKIQLSKSERNFVSTELGNFGVELPKEMLEQPKKEFYIEKKLAQKLFEVKSSIF